MVEESLLIRLGDVTVAKTLSADYQALFDRLPQGLRQRPPEDDGLAKELLDAAIDVDSAASRFLGVKEAGSGR